MDGRTVLHKCIVRNRSKIADLRIEKMDHLTNGKFNEGCFDLVSKMVNEFDLH